MTTLTATLVLLVAGEMLPATAAHAVTRPGAAAPGAVLATPYPRVGPRVAAHRGAVHAGAPEASLAAFQRAAVHGHIVEVDLHFTRDNVPVAVHDATPDRTAVCTGPAIKSFRDVTFAELTARCTLRDAPAGTRIPSWAQVLDIVQRASPRAMVVVELKTAPTTGDLAAFTAPVRQPGLARRVVVNSFVGRWTRDAVAYAELHGAPGLTAGLLTSAARTRTLVAAGGGAAATVRAEAGPRTFMVAAEAGAVTRAWVQQMHTAGLAVWVWTVDSPMQWRRLRVDQVDVIITNLPDEARAALAGRPVIRFQPRQRLHVPTPAGLP